ncbi:hypothetical protein [Vibrio splendidus]|uniref:hypothetical protein n=1 Tax=Vibrio splendidus TaxID=29497 RepID=UPI0024692050|nr:hypothetical protein [Vibrio splendidus]MDH6015628.1 hypothetical protein [Vibrio splendidus]
MKAGDILASKNNTFIKVATLSSWTHVGIAISDTDIFEATPDGVKPIKFEDMLERDNELLLLERPKTLSDKQLETLKNSADVLEKKELKYGFFRAAISGAPRLFHNIFTALSLILLLGATLSFFFNETIEYSYPLLLLSVISQFVGIPLAKSTGTVRKTNKLLEKMGAPKFLLTDLNKMFCSQIVEDLDKKIDGNLSLSLGFSHELRPKDIVIACEELDWNKIKYNKPLKQDK